ncbi:DUF397 domain-containing protein [Streptosporangium sp. NPDC005286]|uniref:DUF397 domain-containing protein n=1 Tax=Streptosporangium sp. NPDC005286 TaxID=3154463 RepID=UPI0033A46AD2
MDFPDLSNLEWRKSSYTGQTGNCVEVANLPGGSRAVRDSKDPNGPTLSFTHTEWQSFTDNIKNGKFD